MGFAPMPTLIPMPLLNWRELAHVVDKIRAELRDERWHIERAFVPERPRFPGGFIKSEWCLRLTSRKQEKTLTISISPRAAYVTLNDGKGPKAAVGATQSPFGLALAKHLKGAKLLDIEVPPRERTLILWVSADSAEAARGASRLGLALTLIPALPEALLIADDGKPAPECANGPPSLRILARSRTIREGEPESRWILPDGSQAPVERPLREEIVNDWNRQVERSLDSEAFDLRVRTLQRLARDSKKQAQDRIRQSETAIQEAEKEPDWQHYGDLLKAWLGQPPALEGKIRRIPDFETGEPVEVPCDPRLQPSAQVEKFYSMSKRKVRRREEARSRLETAREALARADRALIELDSPTLDWKALEARERALGAALPSTGAPSDRTRKESRRAGWMGKSFVSRDGLSIWVGRSRDENLELTFKHSRGNDLWMHVRGRPGAHTLIPLPNGKTAPLETLLDAAVLTIYYSGGEKWGKTEVDYTFKKHVRRIKDSTEASYTHNKTLIVEPDAARLKRLLNGMGSGTSAS